MGRERRTTDVHRTLGEADAVVASVEALRAAPDTLRARARSELGAAWAEEVDTRLRATPITTLKEAAGPGVRWGALRDAGLSSVADVLRAGPTTLGQIRNVGPATVSAVLRAAGDTRSAIGRDVRFRFDADRPTPAQTSLLATLVAIRVADTATRDALPSLDVTATRLAELVAAGRPAADPWWSRIVRGRKKREAVLGAAADLAEFLAEPSTRAAHARIGDLTRAVKPGTRDFDELWSGYRRDAAAVNALLSTLDPGVAGSEDSEAAHGFVPPQVGRAAESVSLDLSRIQPGTTLRAYQAFGARYLLSRGRAILGDEMGLGKTLQALAAVAHLAANGRGRFLVVCPAAVQVNWLNEIDKHTTLRAHSLHGAARATAGREWLRQGGIAVTTFQTLGRLPEDVRSAATALVVVDEAHLIKNPETAVARAVRAALPRADGVIFLTGTPMENRVEEFRRLVEYLNPQVARRVGSQDALAGARAFRRAVAEVYLRRNQDDVLTELPELIETESWVHPTPEDLAHYRDAVASKALTTMRRAAWLAADSAKLARVRQIVEEAAEDGLKVLIFSEFHPALDRVSAEVPGVVGRIDGRVAVAERQRIVQEFSDRGGHAVLVAQIQAGGVGSNVQAASVVVLAEPHWKPGVEEQAIARAHRMGQTRRVQVHRLLAKDTVDERVREVQDGKIRLFNAYARRSDAKDADRRSVDTADHQVERDLVAAERARLGL